jgi:RNase P/RNase MRP subunit p30
VLCYVVFVVMCSGADNHADLRGIYDVINMGQLLNLSLDQVRAAFYFAGERFI